MGFYSSVNAFIAFLKKFHWEFLISIALNLPTTLGTMNIFTKLKHPLHEHDLHPQLLFFNKLSNFLCERLCIFLGLLHRWLILFCIVFFKYEELL